MALADIISLVSSEKDIKIKELTKRQDEEIKSLLDKAKQEGEKYSVQKFNEFEAFQSVLTKKTESEIKRYEKIEISKFQKSLLDEVFLALEKKIASFSENDQITFYAKKIAKIAEMEGEIVSCGTAPEILEKAKNAAGKSFSITKGNGTGGFIFKGDKFTVDFTVHAIVQGEFREKNEADLVDKLFS